MSEENQAFVVEMNGDVLSDLSLADIAGINMDDIAEVRGMPIAPEGNAEWKITMTDIGTREINDKKTSSKVVRPFVTFRCTAQAYRTVKDPALHPADLVGIEHNETFFIRDVLKDVGRIKAFLIDIGCQGSGSLEQLVINARDTEFVAVMKHTVDQNDKDRRFANFDNKTIVPNVGAALPTMAAPAAVPLAAVAAAPAAGGLRFGAAAAG